MAFGFVKRYLHECLGISFNTRLAYQARNQMSMRFCAQYLCFCASIIARMSTGKVLIARLKNKSSRRKNHLGHWKRSRQEGPSCARGMRLIPSLCVISRWWAVTFLITTSAYFLPPMVSRRGIASPMAWFHTAS